MRALVSALAAITAMGVAGQTAAASPQCRDAKGHFTKCPAAAPAKPAKCKDAKGRYAKCDAPGAKPA